MEKQAQWDVLVPESMNRILGQFFTASNTFNFDGVVTYRKCRHSLCHCTYTWFKGWWHPKERNVVAAGPAAGLTTASWWQSEPVDLDCVNSKPLQTICLLSIKKNGLWNFCRWINLNTGPETKDPGKWNGGIYKKLGKKRGGGRGPGK